MSLTAFFKENVVDPYEEVEFAVSKRFSDKDGNPIKWILQPMSPEKALAATEQATHIRKRKADFKASSYLMNIVISSVKFPNLNDAELQDSYGVMSPGELINKMLNSSEYNRLLKKCQEINGLDKEFEELKDEVKN